MEQFSADLCSHSAVLAVEAASHRSFSRHTHDQFGIGVLVQGAQDSASGRGQVRAVCGDMITVNPNEVHDGKPVAGQARRWRMLYLEPTLIAQVARTMDCSAGVEFTRPVLRDRASSMAFERLFDAMTNAAHKPSSDVVEQELFQLIPPLLGPCGVADMGKLAQELASAMARLDAHPEEPVSLQELASEAGVSRFHFLRAFKAATQLPPHAYRLQRQLQLARRLILSGNTLLEAAHEAGFSDQSHLTRHFSASYGLTPGMLGKAHRSTLSSSPPQRGR